MTSHTATSVANNKFFLSDSKKLVKKECQSTMGLFQNELFTTPK